jgi:hypothetical protein
MIMTTMMMIGKVAKVGDLEHEPFCKTGAYSILREGGTRNRAMPASVPCFCYIYSIFVRLNELL